MTNRKKATSRKPKIGSSFESFLREEGTLEETTATAIKRVIAFQLMAAMKKEALSKNALAKRMATSRSQLDRIHCRLKFACMKPESLVIAGQHTTVNVFLTSTTTRNTIARQTKKGLEMSDQKRRELSFSNWEEVIADIEKLASSEHETIGSHSFGKIVQHLATTNQMVVGNITPPKLPWFMRLAMPFLKKGILSNPVEPGFKLPNPAMQEFFWSQTDVDPKEAVENFRASVEVYKAKGPLAVHPIFGKATKEQVEKLSERRAGQDYQIYQFFRLIPARLANDLIKSIKTECSSAARMVAATGFIGKDAETSSRTYEEAFMAEDRIVRNDVLAVGILGLVIFLVASVVTYSPADPASQAPSALLKIYQPDQLVYPANATIQNAGGRLGAWTADLLINVLGVGVYFLIVGLIALEIALFRRSPVESPWLKSIGWAVSLLGLTSLSCMLLPDWTVSPLIGAGGYVGALVSGLMKTNVGTAGAFAGGISMVIGGMMMWTEYLIFRAGRLAFAPALVAATAILPFGLVHGFVKKRKTTKNMSTRMKKRPRKS